YVQGVDITSRLTSRSGTGAMARGGWWPRAFTSIRSTPRGLCFGTLVFPPAMGATLFGSVSRTRRRKVRPQSPRERETPMAQTLQLNKPAPEFTLPDGNRTKVNLKDFRGKSVVLAFYPADWSPVCTNELAIIQETLEDIH